MRIGRYVTIGHGAMIRSQYGRFHFSVFSVSAFDCNWAEKYVKVAAAHRASQDSGAFDPAHGVA